MNQNNFSVIERICFTEIEIKRAIVNLKLNNAMRPNKLGNHILIKLANGLKKPLHLLFNTIANKSTYPIMWKRSEICAIYNKDDKQSVISYRPISLLFSVYKVIKKFIFDKMSTQIFEQLDESQFGFRPKRLTKFQRLKYLDGVHRLLVDFEESPIFAVYADFEKTFDKVEHSLLFTKLSSFAIDDIMIEFFESYLQNRKQRVRTRNQLSNWLDATSGIPQNLFGTRYFFFAS